MSSWIVALESTIISHGMPYPVNLVTAIAVEQILRNSGVVPATTAILEGEMRAGLSENELAFLAESKEIKKASERDIAFILAKKQHAGTTVSASLAIAHAAGIQVFATGGIGGVGPQANQTFDISADLLSIGKYDCITVCAGAKAFMDIPATLEFLETNSIPVLVYQSNRFPLFYARDSRVKVDWELDNPDEIAEVFLKRLSIDQQGGLLVAVPIPAEAAIPENELNEAIQKALQKVKETGVSGKEYTPRVLSAIKEITGGRSLEANVALVKNNARVAGEIAKALVKLKA